MADAVLCLDVGNHVTFSKEKPKKTVAVKNNLAKEHIIVKIKTTSNGLFTIRPAVFGMNGGDEMNVDLIYNPDAPGNRDKLHFAFYYMKVGAADKRTARRIWEDCKGKEGHPAKKHDGSVTIQAEVKELKGTEKEAKKRTEGDDPEKLEEKKDEEDKK